MEIKILGTVAPYCKNGKYCPGYLITSEKEKILLDCGNGISNLLNMEKDLENMTIIISHAHADHYGDLLSLAPTIDIYHKFGIIDKKVTLYLPNENYEKVEEYYTDKDGWGASKTVEKPTINNEFLKHIGNKHYFTVNKYNETNKIRIGNINISFYKTLHPVNTYAVKVQDKTGTIVYSSDTGYGKEGLINFVKDSDVFICESSFLKGQLRTENNHLYANEAAKIAKMANTKQLVLTHFWPEIEKELYVKEASEFFENTIAAEEGMVLKLKR